MRTRALQGWWRGRERREQRMLLVMVAALVAFAGWYGLVAPLRVLEIRARAHHDRAAQALLEARAVADAQRARQPRPRGDALARHLVDSARNAGVAVSRQRPEAGGVIGLAVAQVAAPVLFAWLDGLERDQGLVPAALEVTRVDGGVRAELRFEGDPG